MNLKKIKHKIKEALYCMFHCSFRIAVFRVLGSLVPDSSLRDYIYQYKHTYIIKYLRNKYRDRIALYNKEGSISQNTRVPKLLWIFWWQGMDQAPEIVKSCYASVKHRFAEYDIRVISKINYIDYITLPEFIINKVQSGEMGMAHFSDLLRLSLLERHGGIWMDATLFITGNFLDILAGYSFSSLRYSPEKQLKKYVPMGKWSTFFLAGCPEHILFRFCRELLILYWTNHDYVIDYFLFDYVICLGYEEIPAIREAIDQQPDQIHEYYSLNEYLNERYSEELFQQLIACSPVYKLSYRNNYKDKIEDDITLYQYILQRYQTI